MKVIIYINLTTGLEQLKEFQEKFKDGEAEFHFSHLQSTHLEQVNYKAFLNSVDNDMLMYLALDWPILFVDSGSRYKDGIPRTIYQGLQFLKYVCTRMWFGVDEKDLCKVKCFNCHKFFQEKYAELFINSDTKDNQLCKKFKYFKKYAVPREYFNLVGISQISVFDGKPQEYLDIVSKCLTNKSE